MHRRRLFLLGLGLAGMGVLFLTFLLTRSRPVPKGPNVLVVTIDTTRADRLGCYGFEAISTPNIDRLASEGVLFEQAAATVPITLPSHCSIFTGLIPPHHGVRNNGTYFLRDEVDTLAEILWKRGYETAAFVSAYVLNSQYGLDQGFEVYHDAVHDSSAVVSIEERNARETTDLVIPWLRQPRERPFFLWVHYFDPHQGYLPPSPYLEAYRHDPYSGEIAFVDSQLGRILEEIDLDDTLTIFTADHGEALGAHGERTHAYFVYDSTIRVPLVIRYPDGRNRGTRYRGQVSSVDIVPTILDHLNLPTPEGLDGDSLVEPQTLRAGRRYAYCETIYPFVMGWHPLAGLRDGEWKFIQAPQSELYQVDSDPGETANLIDSHPQVAARMGAFLDEVGPYANLFSDESQKDMTAEDRDRLLALGYLGGGPGAEVSELSDLPDPKEKLGTYLRVFGAKNAFAADMFEEAEQMFRGVLKDEPDILDARLFLGRTLMALGRMDEATEILEQARERLPDNITVYCVLAVLYNQAGLWENAVNVCNAGLEISGRMAPLYDQLGMACQGMEKWGAAVDNGKRAVEENPDQPEYWNNLGAAYFAMGKYREALEPLRKAVSLRDDLSEAQFNLGASLAKLGQYQEAEETFRVTLQVDPENTDALVQLTKVLLYQNRSDEALEHCTELRAIQPDDPGTFYFMSVAYRQKNEPDQAIQALGKYLELVPGFTAGYEEMSMLLLENNRTEEARKYARIAQSKGASLPKELRRIVEDRQGM